MSTVTEIRVVLFPPGAPTTYRRAKTIDQARAIAQEYPDSAPLIEQRQVTASPWQVVWSSTKGGE